jgi:hypothetical protein
LLAQGLFLREVLHEAVATTLTPEPSIARFEYVRLSGSPPTQIAPTIQGRVQTGFACMSHEQMTSMNEKIKQINEH